MLPSTHPLPSLAVPSPPTLRVVLPRFSNTYLVWSDPEPFVGPITGVQIRYLIDEVAVNISELIGGIHAYSVPSIKGSEGKTHSVSLRAKTSAGYGNYSTPVVFTFRPIGEVLGYHGRGQVGWEKIDILPCEVVCSMNSACRVCTSWTHFCLALTTITRKTNGKRRCYVKLWFHSPSVLLMCHLSTTAAGPL